MSEHYEPRPGTVAARVLDYCTEHGPCSTTTLCREVGVVRSRIPGFLLRPIKHGRLHVTKVDGENWYSAQPLGEAQVEIRSRELAGHLQRAWT